MPQNWPKLEFLPLHKDKNHNASDIAVIGHDRGYRLFRASDGLTAHDFPCDIYFNYRYQMGILLTFNVLKKKNIRFGRGFSISLLTSLILSHCSCTTTTITPRNSFDLTVVLMLVNTHEPLDYVQSTCIGGPEHLKHLTKQPKWVFPLNKSFSGKGKGDPENESKVSATDPGMSRLSPHQLYLTICCLGARQKCQRAPNMTSGPICSKVC